MSDDKKQSTSIDDNTVSIELKRAREAKNLSHTDLYRLTGISRSVLSGYETGRTKPGAKEIKLLCEALSVNPNRLLFGSEEPFKPYKGLRGLARMRKSPAGMALYIGLMPIMMATLDDDQMEAILTILISMVEARDKETADKLKVMFEVMLEQVGDGSLENLSTLGSKMNEKEFEEHLNKLINDRIKSESN